MLQFGTDSAAGVARRMASLPPDCIRGSTPDFLLEFTLLSPFLTGRMFLREPSRKYSAKLVGS